MVFSNKNIFEKIVNIALDILILLFSVFLLITIFNNVQVKLLGKSYASFFGFSTFEVKSGSMEKAISIGDWIIVKETKNINLNDIITYKQDDSFITHRVVEKYNGKYVTQGDANSSKDKAVSQNQIVGKVIKILPFAGILLNTIFNPIVLILLIITFYLISSIFKKNNKNKLDLIIDKFLMKFKKNESREKFEVTQLNNLVIEEYEELEPITNEEDDLDKTIYFRAISVDEDEIKNTVDKIVVEDEAKDFKENKEEHLEKIIKSEEIISKSNEKRYKNIIDKVMNMKKVEMEEIIFLLNGKKELMVNEASIIKELIKCYVDAKYYNHCGDVNVEYNNKNKTLNIIYALTDNSDLLLKNYRGNDSSYKDKVKKITNYFVIIMHIDNIIADKNNYEYEKYIQEILKKYYKYKFSKDEITNLIKKIISIKTSNIKLINNTLKSVDSDTFQLVINAINKDDKLFSVNLDYNIEFSKLYSNYIVDKVYDEGIVAEDKLEVLINKLLINITSDMLSSDFLKKYFIIFPETLLKKETKFKKILNIFDDEYAKNSINVLLEYNSLVKYKTKLVKLIKQGYRFGVYFNENNIVKDKELMSLSKYIFVNRTFKNYNKIIESIPSDNVNKVIYGDINNIFNRNSGE